jgi:hypothetical protein
MNTASGDFPAYYATARLWASGQNPYNLSEQCRIQSTIINDGCIPFAHPPYLLPVIAALSNSNYATSYWRWCAFLILVSLLCWFPLYQVTRDSQTVLQALLFFPLMIGLFMGIDTIVVFLAVALWLWLINSNKDFWAGMALAVGLVKPQLIVMLALPLLFSRRKAFLGFCVGGAVLTFSSLGLVGIQGFRGIIELTSLTAKGQGFGFYQERMGNFMGILARAEISPFWAWPVFAIAIAVIALVWRRFGLNPQSIALAMVLTLFASPHVHGYDMALLIIPVMFIHPLAPAIATIVTIVAYSIHREYLGFDVLLLSVFLYAVSCILRGRRFELKHEPDKPSDFDTSARQRAPVSVSQVAAHPVNRQLIGGN